MNNRSYRTILAFLLLFGAGTIAHAQERRLPPAVLGVIGGYNYGYGVPVSSWANDLDNQPYDNHIQNLEGGLSFIFPKIFGNGAGISTTITYGTYSLNASRMGERTVEHSNRADETALTDHRYEFRSKSVQMDLMGYIHMGSVARFEFGPWGGVGFLPKYTETESILTPGVVFDNGTSERYDDGYDPAGAIFLTGFAVRASFEIPIMGGMALLPAINLRAAGIVTPDGEQGGVIGTAGAGMGILFGQTNGEIIEVPPPPPAPPTSAIDTVADTTAQLQATVDLYSQDGSGRRIDTLLVSPRRTLHRMEMPLTPVFYFEQNSAALPERYTGYSASNREEFSLDALVGLGAADIHRQGLNVIGSRLASTPEASIAIWGTTAPGEPKWFATARAEAVRGYLARTWGVPESRMTVKVADGREKGPATAGSRSVMIASAERNVLEPIVTEWIEQEVESAPIGLEPRIASANGVRGWRATVLQEGREIGVLRNTDSVGTGILDAGVVLRNISTDRSMPKLNAELVVEDSSGAVMVARDEMVVVVVNQGGSGAPDAIDRRVNDYLLSDRSEREIAPLVEQLVRSVGDSASIAIAPLVAGAEGDRSVVQGRLRRMAERIRTAFAGNGKHLTRLDIREQAATQYGRGDDGELISSLIQVTVVE